MAAAVAMATIGALAPSIQTAAQARKPACSSAAKTHKRGVHTCVGTSRKAKGHGHSKASGHHARHATKKAKRRSRKTTRKGKQTTATPAQTTKAGCEDGSSAVHAGSSSFVCDDGSQPQCENGSFPMVSKTGSTLLCNQPPAPAKGGSGDSGSGAKENEPEEALCEDGSAAFASGGSFICDDGSEPSCEEGEYPAVSSDGSRLECTSEEAET